LRLDAGVEAGDEVPIHYDPLLAKLVAWGEDRERAIERLATALDQMVVEGPSTSLAFHRWLVQEPSFRQGPVDTGFVAERWSGVGS
jgi:acetyl/propionyl-CoA carboxylase alpha subunit